MNTASRMAMQQAFADHQAGRLDRAIAMYDRILAGEPQHPDANHLRGVAALQRREYATAAPFLEKAVALNRRNPDYLMNYATCLQEMGKPAEAVPLYRRALQARPNHPDTMFNLGNALVRAGQGADAVPLYRKLLVQAPENPVLRQALGLALTACGERTAGLAELRAAVELAPGAAEPACNLIVALREARETEEAARRGADALLRFPDNAEVRNLAGLSAEDAGDDTAAEAHFHEALRLAPGFAEPCINLGNLARRQGNLAAARDRLNEAVAKAPANPVAHNNLANALFVLGERDAAFSHYREAVALDPSYANGWSSLGVALRAAGLPGEAIASFDRALAIDPDHRDARMGRAVVRLLRGEFTQGWNDYLGRDSIFADRHRFHRDPLPADLTGKRILIERDQGLGDELFFLRFAAELRSRGASTAYIPDDRIAAMIARAGIVDEVVGESEPPCDYRVSVGDLPWLVGMGDGDSVPGPFPIPPVAGIETGLAERLAACGPRPWIAVTWRAGTDNADRLLFKAAPPAGIAAAIQGATGTVFAVQRGPREGELAAFERDLGRPVHDLTALNADLETMLALMGLFDVYVGVSNTNVHLRAARAERSHVLVPSPPEFRWMQSGETSPWFPDCPVYRQDSDGLWISALSVLEKALKAG